MTETPVNDRSLLKIISVHSKLMYWNISSLSKAYNYYTIKQLGKLTIPRAGPYKVIRQNNNGSILIEKSPTDTENVNIRRISPYYLRMETPID